METPRDIEESQTTLLLAQELFERYYARCFWHMKPDLRITESLVPLVVKGLKANGGREGMLEAARLSEHMR